MAPLFLRLIAWKSLTQSIQNSHFCHCQHQKVTSFLVKSAVALSNFQCKQKRIKQRKHLWKKKSSLKKISIDWVRLFMIIINLKNNGAIVIPRFFNYMWVISDEFWWHRWKIYLSRVEYQVFWTLPKSPKQLVNWLER